MSLITVNNPTSTTAEAYRALRTNLHFAALEAPIKTLLITSPSQQEQGDVMAANLAISLAQIEKSVILVDANARQPILAGLLGLSNSTGLLNLLAEPTLTLAAVLQQSAVPGLRLLSSGTLAQPASDLISSPRMITLIQGLTAQADFVIFYAPAILTASDSAMLASQVDAVMLAIQVDKTRRDDAQQAKEILIRAKARLLGAVMLH